MEKVQVTLKALLEARDILNRMVLDTDTKIVSAVKQSVIKEISQKLDSEIETQKQIIKMLQDVEDVRRPDPPKRMRLIDDGEDI
jgi:putative ubiquitin-RnfH superfamily antitoxin RatB of RatAB toxin-antitoxin module